MKRLRVRERKLGRYKHPADPARKLLGAYWPKQHLVEIDPRQSPRTRLNTLLHEVLHSVLPDVCETRIERTGSALSRVLWEQGYRR